MGHLDMYFSSIMTVGICSFICEALSINGKYSKALTHGLSLITSLCIFLTVISPFFVGVSDINLSEITNNNGISADTEDYFIMLTNDEIEKAITDKIINNCGIQAEKLDAELKNRNGELSITEMTVWIKKGDSTKEKEIINTVKEAAGKDVRVIINVVEENGLTDG